MIFFLLVVWNNIFNMEHKITVGINMITGTRPNIRKQQPNISFTNIKKMQNLSLNNSSKYFLLLHLLGLGENSECIFIWIKGNRPETFTLALKWKHMETGVLFLT